MQEFKYHDKERRSVVCLDEATIDEIAERAAEKAMVMMEKKLYEQVGKTVISRFLIAVGTVVLGAWVILKNDFK